MPLENSDQNTSKDNSFELISSPDSEVAKIFQEIEAQGKAHNLVHSQLFGPEVRPKQDEILNSPEIPVDVQHPQPSTSQVLSGLAEDEKINLTCPWTYFWNVVGKKRKVRKASKKKYKAC